MKKESLKQQAYNIIKEKIIQCEYAPGTFLNEGILMEEVAVSRTPIREALNRLEQEGLVQIIPKKGLMIAPLSFNEINMIYETRILIEPFIIRNYSADANKDALLEMRPLFTDDALLQQNQRIFFAKDDELHQLIYSFCDNRYLLDTMERIYAQNFRVRILSGNIDQRLESSCREHIKLIDSIVAEDYEQAAVLMEEHLASSKNAAFSLLVNNGGWKL